MTTAKIYALVSPISGEIKYIGKTNYSLNERLRTHLKDKDVNKRTLWIKSLSKEKLTPLIECLDEVPHNEWQLWEQYYIFLFRSWGFNLVNGTMGGDGGVINTPEVKEKIRAKLVGRYFGRSNKPVLQYSLDGNFIKEFCSTAEAGKEINKSRANISRGVKTNRACGGYLWRFKIGEIPTKIDTDYINGRVPISEKHRESARMQGLLTKGRITSNETRLKQSLAKMAKKWK